MPLKIQGYGSDEKIESERSLVWLRNSREEKWENYQQEGELHYIKRKRPPKIITTHLLMPGAAFYLVVGYCPSLCGIALSHF
jgi:hypothetical protein